MTTLCNPILKTACMTILLFSLQVQADTYQLFLVRHAEKAQTTTADPELSACGKLQATALATLLQHLQLPQIFHTPYQRTKMTAAALLKQDRRLQPYDPAKLAGLSQQLLQAKQSAVVVGHSNTTPQLAALLSGLDIQPMSEQHYGVIYQLMFSGQGFVALNQLQLPQPESCQQK